MQWIIDNKDWLFSGAGISILAVIFWLFQKLYTNTSNLVIIKIALGIFLVVVICLVIWGITSGELTVLRKFSWLHLASPAVFAVGAAGWIAFIVARYRVESLSLELTSVKTHDTFRDHVTHILNTNAIAHTFVECLTIAKNYGGKFSGLLLDLDDFKRINELHDIKGGDRCLREVAILLNKTLRGESDKLIRFRHGDEFLILLPETSVDNAEFVAKRIVRLIEKTEFPISENNYERLTASVGYTEINAETDNIDMV